MRHPLTAASWTLADLVPSTGFDEVTFEERDAVDVVVEKLKAAREADEQNTLFPPGPMLAGCLEHDRLLGNDCEIFRRWRFDQRVHVRKDLCKLRADAIRTPACRASSMAGHQGAQRQDRSQPHKGQVARRPKRRKLVRAA
jgi:hypothetical protein